MSPPEHSPQPPTSWQDVVIVGGGAAGLTAALYVARAGLRVTVADHGRSVLKRAQLNNLAGPGAVSGESFLVAMRKRSSAAGACLLDSKVLDVASAENGFVVSTEHSAIHARAVVLATGQGGLSLPGLELVTEPPRQPYVRVNVATDRWGATSVHGVWACGVVAGWPSQAAACAGSGAAVAVEVVSHLLGDFWVDHDDALPGA